MTFIRKFDTMKISFPFWDLFVLIDNEPLNKSSEADILSAFSNYFVVWSKTSQWNSKNTRKPHDQNQD